MSIVKTIENVELERENGRALREAMRGKKMTLLLSVDALHSQAIAQAEHLLILKEEITKSFDSMLQEMDNRDEALRQIIEGDNAQ
jgi:hypothetical protein